MKLIFAKDREKNIDTPFAISCKLKIVNEERHGLGMLKKKAVKAAIEHRKFTLHSVDETEGTVTLQKRTL